jgi:hypothetical protein
MNNLAKVEEEQHKNRYLSYAEQQKHKESDGEFHYTPTSTTRNYYDEEIIDRDGPFIIYQLGTVCESIFKNAADRFPTGINIVAFHKKISSFYKLPKVRQLTDCLYNVVEI